MEKQIQLPISQMANGAIQEKLDGEFKKVFDNIHDPKYQSRGQAYCDNKT